MSKLSVKLDIDGKEVTIVSMEADGDVKFSPLQIAQLVGLASTATGRRQTFFQGDQFPTSDEDIEHVGNRYQRLLYGEQST